MHYQHRLSRAASLTVGQVDTTKTKPRVLLASFVVTLLVVLPRIPVMILVAAQQNNIGAIAIRLIMAIGVGIPVAYSAGLAYRRIIHTTSDPANDYVEKSESSQKRVRAKVAIDRARLNLRGSE